MAMHKENADLEHHLTSNGNGQPLSKTVSIDADLFERLYLQPKNQVSGDLRRTFANPTPLALLGFSVALLPITTAYMGWAGATGNSATIAASIWYGGLCLIIAGVMEWILGNFFPFLVFMGYGCHFLTIATTFVPAYGTLSAYTTDGSSTITPEFAATFGFYPLSLALLSFCYLVGSFRTNLAFVIIFICATTGFGAAAGAFWHISKGNIALATTLIKAVGAFFFVADVIGWYLLLGSIITLMEMPIPDLPVFDLSTVIKAKPRGG